MNRRQTVLVTGLDPMGDVNRELAILHARGLVGKVVTGADTNIDRAAKAWSDARGIPCTTVTGFGLERQGRMLSESPGLLLLFPGDAHEPTMELASAAVREGIRVVMVGRRRWPA